MRYTSSIGTLLLLAVACDNPEGGFDRTNEPLAVGKADGAGACETTPSTFFVLSRDGDGVRTLHQGSLSDLSVREIGTVDYDGDLWELVPGPQDHLYAIDRDDDALVELSPWAAKVKRVVPLDADMHRNGRGFALHPDGSLYGLFERTQLRTIDADTGETELVAQIRGIGGAEAMTFCPDGSLYIAASPTGSPKGSHLFAVDPTTGAVTARGRIGTKVIDIDSLTCSAAMQLYGADADTEIGADLQQVDPRTGTRIRLSSLAVGGIVDGVSMALGTAPASQAP